MIRIYSTLSKQKEEFVPVVPGQVGIYLCGPTVYKPSHIGHMVGPVIFDAIKRYLSYNGYDVKFVINITDVDDKLIAESNARNMPMSAIAAEMTADYLRNLEAMGVKESVTKFPKATDHIGNIINFTQDLIDKGFAYASDGDVYFDVAKFPDYGKLSHRALDSMQGEGGGTAERKRSPYDFALWKSAKPGEPSWDSPWGAGRPGWHIECSVMSCELLGETFDIHGGGLDLMFPHHENEVAQSEPMCNFWMHNGLMQASNEVGKLGGRNTRVSPHPNPSATMLSEEEGTADQGRIREEAVEGDLTSQEAGKISKSKGSSAFSEMLKKFAPELIRFFLLSTHYRRPIDFSEERITEVGKGLETFYRFTKRFAKLTGHDFYALGVAKTRCEGDKLDLREPLSKQIADYRTKFLEAMDDDFNTGAAVATLFDLLRALNKFIDDNKLETLSDKSSMAFGPLLHGAAVLRELGLTLGLFREPPAEKVPSGSDELTGKLMALLIELRTNAKKAKDFAAADLIRNRLKDLGIALEDRPDGTEWSLN